MRRQPITCPKCEAVYEEEAPVRGRRTRPAPVEKKAKTVPLPDESQDVMEGVDEPDLVDDDDTGDDEGSDMIEDASDLGEDDEDMAEVIDHLDNKNDDD